MLKIETVPDLNSDYIRIANLKILKGSYELPGIVLVIQKRKTTLKTADFLLYYELTFCSLFFKTWEKNHISMFIFFVFFCMFYTFKIKYL